MSATRTPRSHVVAKVDVLDAVVKAKGFRSRSAFARSLKGKPGAPGVATVKNLWQGNVVGIDFAEVIAAALDTPVGELFQLSNGRGIQ